MIRLWICCLLVGFFASGVQSTDNCGTRKLERPLINGGNLSRRGEWPWHAAIFHRMNETAPRYACGGSIIARRYILTAAHCTYLPSQPLEASEMLVRVGIINLQNPEHSLQESSVEKIIRPERYRARGPGKDIAILKLTEELEVSDYVSPICLWSEDDRRMDREEGFVAGWGLDDNYQLSDDLTHASMSFVSAVDCTKTEPQFFGFMLDEGTFCAGFTKGTSIGTGISGGGLYIKEDGQWKLRGVTSTGKVKANAEFDTSSFVVFTDVGHYLSWIERSVELEGLAAEQLSLGT